MELITLSNTPIGEQLALEENLLRNETNNFCLINTGSSPAIVMGISSHSENFVHLDKLPSHIPILRRFSGGGTVIVDENTLFVTFICNKASHAFPAYPEPILRWAASILSATIPGLELRENDFVIGNKKCGGNALYIKKERWLIHTSLLWDYETAHMELLKHPPKTPTYRAGRPHGEFLCKLAEVIPDRKIWVEKFKRYVQGLC
jgi:lipoate---protein ligase